ncbi:MAG: protein kinase [Deltaproteobacteria bacterium]|nr:protein kinase [Deltaproteobacteria bacterium]
MSEQAPDDASEVEADDPFDFDDATIALKPSDVGGIFGDRFRVEGELGEGATGRVVLALDLRTDQRVALKILHPPKKKKRPDSPSPDVTPGAMGSSERFVREVVALSEIDHPAVVKIVAHDRASDGRWWIAMELLDGETLGARLKRTGAMPLAEAWPILGTLAGGLAAAHRAGYVHRDLKPDNVFLPASGRPACKILDFGFARHKTKQARITATGALIGTPRFMAPEVLADARVLDGRADVYALGVLAFEMLTARSIYPADDFSQLVGCILQGRTIRLRDVLPDASEELEALLVEATARDPEARLPSAELFAMRLAEIAGLRSDGPRSEGPRAPRSTPPPPSAAKSVPSTPPTAIAAPSTRSAFPAARSNAANVRAWIFVGVLVVIAVVVCGMAWDLRH